MTRSTWTLGLVGLLGTLGCEPEPTPQPSEPLELSVGCEGSGYAQIAAAARVAGAGDVVEICAGTYEGGIVVDDAFALVAREGDEVVVVGQSDEPDLQITLGNDVAGTARVSGLRLTGEGFATHVEVSARAGATVELDAIEATTVHLRGNAAYSISNSTVADSEDGWGLNAALEDGATLTVTDSTFTGHSKAAWSIRDLGPQCDTEEFVTLTVMASGVVFDDSEWAVTDVPDDDYPGIDAGCDAHLEMTFEESTFGNLEQRFATRWEGGPLHDLTLREVTMEGSFAEGLTTSGAALTIEGLTYSGAVQPLMTIDGVHNDLVAVSGLRLHSNTTSAALVRLDIDWLTDRGEPLVCALCDMGTGDTANASAELAIVQRDGDLIEHALPDSPWDFDGELRWSCDATGCEQL